MNILWVKSGGFLPLDTGGKIRSFNIARELSRRHQVSLFTFYPRVTPDPHVRLKEIFEHVECVPQDLPERGGAQDTLAYMMNAPTGMPYQMRKYCRPEVRRQLEKFLATHRYDVLLCDFLLTAGAVPWDRQIPPTVIFTHNVEAVIWHRHFLVNRNPLWKIVSWREYRTMARAERHYLKLADHVLTVSDHDRDAFGAFLPPEKITTIPTGVDLDYFRPADRRSMEPTLVFTGGMDWMPNEDGILFFCSDVLPRIQRSIPAVKLVVVGRRPTRKVLALSEHNPAIRVTGAVEDIRPFVENAAVYVVPLRVGGGTRIKIFEAMAMGMPVVSTSIGAEGLPVEHNRTILLADSAEDFAARAIELLNSPQDRQRIGREARALVERRYGWSAVTDVLDRTLQSLEAAAGRHVGVISAV